MNSYPEGTDRVVSRARWLNELSQALDRAGKLALELSDDQGQRAAAGAIGTQIASLREEVDSLLRGRSIPYGDLPPEWVV